MLPNYNGQQVVVVGEVVSQVRPPPTHAQGWSPCTIRATAAEPSWLGLRTNHSSRITRPHPQGDGMITLKCSDGQEVQVSAKDDQPYP